MARYPINLQSRGPRLQQLDGTCAAGLLGATPAYFFGSGRSMQKNRGRTRAKRECRLLIWVLGWGRGFAPHALSQGRAKLVEEDEEE